MGVEPTLFHLASGRFTTKLHPRSVPIISQDSSDKQVNLVIKFMFLIAEVVVLSRPKWRNW